MSSPRLNNLIVLGGMLVYASIIFHGIDLNLVDEAAYPVMCKVITIL